jgi:hypothetical protein
MEVLMRITGWTGLMALLILTGAYAASAEAGMHAQAPDRQCTPQTEDEDKEDAKGEPAPAETGGDQAPDPQEGEGAATESRSAEETPDLKRMKEELKRELLAELGADRASEEVVASAKGKILWRGAPLEGCRVKAMRLETVGLFGTVRLLDSGQEVVTAADGSYHFKSLEPGSYKLSWVPGSGAHWIRRLRSEADFEVQSGKQTEIEPLDVARGTLN